MGMTRAMKTMMKVLMMVVVGAQFSGPLLSLHQ
jgi:hypothetical protein